MTNANSPALAQVIELMGRKWTMRIVWELRNGPMTFRDLQRASGGISPTVLNARIHDLDVHGLLERSEKGYCLSPLGEELLVVYKPLGQWAKKWVRKCGGLKT